MRTTKSAFILLALAGALALPAQEGPCDQGEERIGWLGLERLEMRHYSVRQDDGLDNLEVWIRSEPEVRTVASGSPAAGVLHPGDVITAVGDHLVTTREAGRLLALPTPGQPLALKIRRGGRLRTVELTPEAVCAEDVELFWGPPDPPPAPRAPRAPRPPREPRPEAPAAPEAPPAPAAGPAPEAAPRPPRPPRPPLPPLPPRPPRAPRAPAPPAPPALPASSGWLGLGFECSDCGWVEGDDGPVFRFASPPAIYSVDPGSPAERAGLEPGDVLTTVGGVPVTRAAGAADLFAAGPGDELELGYERDGEARRATARIEDRLRAGMHLRYDGQFEGTAVEVWGHESVQVKVEGDGETMTIRTHDTLIRLRRHDGG